MTFNKQASSPRLPLLLSTAIALAAGFNVGTAYAEAAAAAEPGSEIVVVVGQRDNLLSIAGSGSTIEQADLVKSRVFTVNEALRQASGVFARDEEGLGVRPNIGIRGLSPIRSTKVLLLEDGLPLGYAPYGDNAAYYHPPIRRFSRIEILKGASQIRFGPNSIGGVINYVTPAAPDRFKANVTIAAGNEDYREIDGAIGGPIGHTRALLHVNATTSNGARDNQEINFSDVYLKLERDFGENHQVTFRASRYAEDSQLSYSGLTLAEYQANPRQNPFKDDNFEIDRIGAALSWNWDLSDTLSVKTAAYYSYFDRDWWRQSSNSSQRPNDASDPLCGGMANLFTTCGNEGRLRTYHTHGIESRLSHVREARGIKLESEVGVRATFERQARVQINSDSSTGRTPGTSVNGGVRENNLRYADAWSVFATTKASIGNFTISPGVRFEEISYERVNQLVPTAIVRGESSLSEVIPGIGATFAINPKFVVYGGVHRGFAPPRVEDVISNTTGGSVDLDAELSTNFELGVRGEVTSGFNVDVAWFRLDFENQIVPQSVAGGVGTSLTSAGETLHQGFEASTRISLKDMGRMDTNDIYMRAAVTWVRDASFEGPRFSNVSGFNTVSVSGNRLPYAPEWLLTAAIGYELEGWGQVQLEYVRTDEMFTDDLNTVAVAANGQRGLIEGTDIFNATLNVTPKDWRVGFYATVKNLTDQETIVDRARGILPGSRRLFQLGIVASY